MKKNYLCSIHLPSQVFWKTDAFFIILFFFVVLIATAQSSDKPTWQAYPSPINSNLNYIHIFSDQTAIASGKQIIQLSEGQWTLVEKQPPLNVDKIFAVNKNSIFIISNTKFQESELYYWNGKDWKKQYHPLVNTILSGHFLNPSNGIIAGLGELAILNDKQWEFLPTPTINNIIYVHRDKKATIWALSQLDGLYNYTNKWKKINGSDQVRLAKYIQDKLYVIGSDFFGVVQSDSIKKIGFHNNLKLVNDFIVNSNNELQTVGLNGLLLSYKNQLWEEQISPIKENLNSIGNISPNNGWCLGNDGTILLYTQKPERIEFQSQWKGFEKKTHKANAKLIDDEYGVVTTDFNNDGLIDIFTCGLFEPNHLYINQGNMIFSDYSTKMGVSGVSDDTIPHPLNLGACAGDIDNDGFDDLYVTVLNGSNKIYKNSNGNYFVDYSNISKAIGQANDRTNTCAMVDVDNDGDIDIYITNEYTTNRIYLNNGVGIFTEATISLGLQTVQGGMGATFGDIDGDGDVDLYVVNWSSSNKLYKNLLKETGRLQFQDITDVTNVGGDNYTKSNSVIMSDIDNDADLDIYVTNRKKSNKLYRNDGTGNFTDVTEAVGIVDSLKTNGVLIYDFDGDGWKDIYLSNVGDNTLFKSDGKGKFTKQTIKYGANIDGYSTGSAVADFDNDGDLDIYVANYIGESSTFLKNKLNTHSYIKLTVRGYENNRNAIGSKIYVYKDGGLNDASQLIYYKQITAGSGYASMSSLHKPIQIQDNQFVAVKVVYPTGIVQTRTHIKTGSHLEITDVTGWRKKGKIISTFLLKQVLDPHRLFELLKWIFILICIGVSMQIGHKKYRWFKIFTFGLSVGLVLLYLFQFLKFEYDPFFLSTLLPITSVLMVIALVHLYFEQKRIKWQTNLSQNRTREKLSRDLHDDLASTISTISIYLTLMRYKLTGNQDKVKTLISDTETMVGNATDSITDLIWTINPKQETLTNLFIRINKNFSDIFREKNIEFSIDNKCKNDNYILKNTYKQNLFLILKEALNNILKHAEATHVSIEVLKEGKKIRISISDNGVGFDYEQVKNKGHGMCNMQQRAKEIKASLKLESEKGKGSSCTIVLGKLKN
ncbi:MAG: FG-GAP-like repeat-containing protein [Flavobacteriaceae bacterium]|nr:FG-GAP-like repeat-containing protein [Flavobacteriaceae bacterium]